MPPWTSTIPRISIWCAAWSRDAVVPQRPVRLSVDLNRGRRNLDIVERAARDRGFCGPRRREEQFLEIDADSDERLAFPRISTQPLPIGEDARIVSGMELDQTKRGALQAFETGEFQREQIPLLTEMLFLVADRIEISVRIDQKLEISFSLRPGTVLSA